jgi:hypothetical protein
MMVHTPGGSSWPARCAYAAAALFTAASGITNLVYGLAKGFRCTQRQRGRGNHLRLILAGRNQFVRGQAAQRSADRSRGTAALRGVQCDRGTRFCCGRPNERSSRAKVQAAYEAAKSSSIRSTRPGKRQRSKPRLRLHVRNWRSCPLQDRWPSWKLSCGARVHPALHSKARSRPTAPSMMWSWPEHGSDPASRLRWWS